MRVETPRYVSVRLRKPTGRQFKGIVLEQPALFLPGRGYLKTHDVVAQRLERQLFNLGAEERPQRGRIDHYEYVGISSNPIYITKGNCQELAKGY